MQKSARLITHADVGPVKHRRNYERRSHPKGRYLGPLILDPSQFHRPNAVLREAVRQLEELEVLMLSLHRGTKLCAAIVVAAIMLIGALSWSYAEPGSVRLNIVKAGFIVGIGG